MFSRKFLLIFIGIFTEFFPKTAKATMFLVIIIVYTYLQLKYKPYNLDYLNRLEFYSLLVSFFTGNIGILLFSKDVKVAAVFFLSLVALMNLGFISFWLHQFLTRVIAKEQAIQIFQPFFDYFRSLLKVKRKKKRA